MDEFSNAEQLKEFILTYRTDAEEEFNSTAGPCYGLSWKKDHWVVKMNNKVVGTIGQKEVPKGFDLRTPQLLTDALAILRKAGPDGLSKYLKALKRDRKQE